MRNRTFFSKDWSQSAAGYRLAGWIRALGLLAGCTISQLAELPQAGQWFWAASLASGFLLTGTGLFYLLRRARPRHWPADTRVELLPESVLHRRTVRVTIWPSAPDGEALPQPVEQTRAIPPGDAWQGSMLVALGVWMLAAGSAGVLAAAAELAQASRVTAYLGSPALLLWCALEGLALAAGWRQYSEPQAKRLLLLSRGGGALAAALAWVYLGLAAGGAQVEALFWLAVGLALLGVLASSFLPVPETAPDAARTARQNSQTENGLTG